MAKEAVERIREAESEAAKIRAEAEKTGKGVLDLAERDGERLLKDTEAEARAAFSEAVRNVEAETSAQASRCAADADTAIRELRASSAKLAGEAVKLIVDTVMR